MNGSKLASQPPGPRSHGNAAPKPGAAVSYRNTLPGQNSPACGALPNASRSTCAGSTPSAHQYGPCSSSPRCALPPGQKRPARRRSRRPAAPGTGPERPSPRPAERGKQKLALAFRRAQRKADACRGRRGLVKHKQVIAQRALVHIAAEIRIHLAAGGCVVMMRQLQRRQCLCRQGHGGIRHQKGHAAASRKRAAKAYRPRKFIHTV